MPTATITKTVSRKPETPFGDRPPWQWNECPTAGVPTRARAQLVANDDERKRASEIIAEYRELEVVSDTNDISGKTHKLNQSIRVPTMGAIEQENLRREISRADHSAFEKAQTRLAALREEAFLLVSPAIRRLIASLDDELNAVAIDAEAKLGRSGIPIRIGSEWTLFGDVLVCALWSQRHIAAKSLTALQGHRDGVPATQYILTDEQHTPFTWAV